MPQPHLSTSPGPGAAGCCAPRPAAPAGAAPAAAGAAAAESASALASVVGRLLASSSVSMKLISDTSSASELRGMLLASEAVDSAGPLHPAVCRLPGLDWKGDGASADGATGPRPAAPGGRGGRRALAAGGGGWAAAAGGVACCCACSACCASGGQRSSSSSMRPATAGRLATKGSTCWAFTWEPPTDGMEERPSNLRCATHAAGAAGMTGMTGEACTRSAPTQAEEGL